MLVALDAERRITGIAPRLEPWFAASFGVRACRVVGIGTPLPEAIDRAVAAQFDAIDAALAIATAPVQVPGRDGNCAIQALWRGDAERDALVLIRRIASPAPARAPAVSRQQSLTAREREVLQWVAAGKTNAQIGAILSASPRTVGKHLENIYEKLGVETRTAAVNRGIA
jgi:DNA-binding CsgD family transcriptional regulator